MAKINAEIEFEAISPEGKDLDWKARLSDYGDGDPVLVQIYNKNEEMVFEITITELEEVVTHAHTIKEHVNIEA